MALQQQFIAIDPSTQELRRFRSTKPQMDTFLARHAAKNAKLGLSMTWVLLEDTLGKRSKYPVAAYYTLAGGSITKQSIAAAPQDLPGYPLPVTILARLAVGKNYQGRHLGSKTLVTALRQAVLLSHKGLPSYGVVLDVLDEDALGFYRRFDFFQPFSGDPMRLFAPMHALKTL